MNDSIKASQALLTLAAFVVVVAGMKAAVDILVPFLLAGFLSIIATAPMFWLQRKGLPAWLALIVVILGIFAVGLLIATLAGSSINDFTQDMPLYQEKLKQQTGKVMALLAKFGVDVSGLKLSEKFDAGAAMRLVSMILNGLTSALANGLLIIMTVIFMLLEAASFPLKLELIFGNGESSLKSFDRFTANLKGYMAIKTWVSLATGVCVGILVAIIGVDYPVLWGVLAFALNYIPNIGSIIAAVPTVLLALVQLSALHALATATVYLVVNLVMGSVVEPRFMGRGLGLSALVVFLSLLFWGWVLGPVGMLLSVPLTITAKIALDSHEGTRWIAILLGPEIIDAPKTNDDDKTSE